MLMLTLRNLTEPSAKRKLAPPGWRLLNPLDVDENRQPRGLGVSHLPKQEASPAGKVFESKFIGTVVPAVPPLVTKKALLAVFSGRTSPAMMLLLVPSVTLAMVATWADP